MPEKSFLFRMSSEKIFSEMREHPAFTAYLRQDGIVHFVMKEIEDYSLGILSEQLSLVNEFGKGKKMPVLLTINDYSSPNEETMQYAAKKEEANKELKAVAVVVDSFALRLGTNFYIKFFKPKISTKLFNSEKDAVLWLKTFE